MLKLYYVEAMDRYYPNGGTQDIYLITPSITDALEKEKELGKAFHFTEIYYLELDKHGLDFVPIDRSTIEKELR